MIKVPPKIVCQDEKGIPKAVGKRIWCKMGIAQDCPPPTPPPKKKQTLSLITHCSRLQIARKKLRTAAGKRQDKELVKNQNTKRLFNWKITLHNLIFLKRYPMKIVRQC